MRLNVNGHSAYAYTGGKPLDPALPAIVFVHGAQHDHSVWILQSRYLAHHGFGVLALDLPGHGRSEAAPLSSIRALAEWVIAVLDAAGVERAIVVGHSMGSLTALEAASCFPERIAAIVLVATAYPMKVSPALLEAARDDEPRAFDMINIWSHSTTWGGFSQKPSNPGPGFSLAWSNRQLMARQNRGVLSNDFEACNAYDNGEVAAAAMSCPALFILGERDSMTPMKSGIALARRMARHEVKVIPGAGHDVMGEAPDALLEAIYAFASVNATAARQA